MDALRRRLAALTAPREVPGSEGTVAMVPGPAAATGADRVERRQAAPPGPTAEVGAGAGLAPGVRLGGRGRGTPALPPPPPGGMRPVPVGSLSARRAISPGEALALRGEWRAAWAAFARTRAERPNDAVAILQGLRLVQQGIGKSWQPTLEAALMACEPTAEGRMGLCLELWRAPGPLWNEPAIMALLACARLDAQALWRRLSNPPPDHVGDWLDHAAGLDDAEGLAWLWGRGRPTAEGRWGPDELDRALAAAGRAGAAHAADFLLGADGHALGRASAPVLAALGEAARPSGSPLLVALARAGRVDAPLMQAVYAEWEWPTLIAFLRREGSCRRPLPGCLMEAMLGRAEPITAMLADLAHTWPRRRFVCPETQETFAQTARRVHRAALAEGRDKVAGRARAALDHWLCDPLRELLLTGPTRRQTAPSAAPPTRPTFADAALADSAEGVGALHAAAEQALARLSAEDFCLRARTSPAGAANYLAGLDEAYGAERVRAIFRAPSAEARRRAMRDLAVALHPDRARQRRRPAAQVALCTLLNACLNGLRDLWAEDPTLLEMVAMAAGVPDLPPAPEAR